MTVPMGTPEMPGVIKEMGEEEEEEEEEKKKNNPLVTKAGVNPYTSTISLRAMDPPTDEEMYERLSSKPGAEF